MIKEPGKPKEDTEIVFLRTHTHSGVDYKDGDVAKVTAQAAEKLVKRAIAKLAKEVKT